MGRDGSKRDAGTGDDAVSGGAQGDGHAQDRKVERAATAQLQVDALPASGGRQDDLTEYLIRGFRVGVYAIVAKQLLYRYYTLAAHADKDGGGVCRRDGPAARAARSNQADVAIFLHAVADGVPPELGLIVVVAAGIQEQVATDGASVAQLRRRNGIGSGSKSAIMLLYCRMLGDCCEGNASAQAKALVGRATDALQRFDGAQADQDRRSKLAALHIGEEVGAASNQHGRIAFLCEHVRSLFEATGGQIAKGWKAQHQDTLPFVGMGPGVPSSRLGYGGRP